MNDVFTKILNAKLFPLESINMNQKEQTQRINAKPIIGNFWSCV